MSVIRGVSCPLAAEKQKPTADTDNLNPKDIDERMANWHQTSRNWRVASRVLSVSLASSFENAEIGILFQQIIEKRKHLGDEIMNFPKPGAGTHTPDQENALRESLSKANGMVNEIGDLLQQCGKLMVSETRTPSAP